MPSSVTNRPWTYFPGRPVERRNQPGIVALMSRRCRGRASRGAPHAASSGHRARHDQRAVLAHEARVELPRELELQLNPAALDAQQVEAT